MFICTKAVHHNIPSEASDLARDNKVMDEAKGFLEFGKHFLEKATIISTCRHFYHLQPLTEEHLLGDCGNNRQSDYRNLHFIADAKLKRSYNGVVTWYLRNVSVSPLTWDKPAQEKYITFREK